MTIADVALKGQPVDRRRRHRFVVGVVGFSLIAATFLALLSGLGILTTLASVSVTIQGLLYGGFAVATAYLTGSVVDYTMGSGGKDFNQPDDTGSYG